MVRGLLCIFFASRHPVGNSQAAGCLLQVSMPLQETLGHVHSRAVDNVWILSNTVSSVFSTRSDSNQYISCSKAPESKPLRVSPVNTSNSTLTPSTALTVILSPHRDDRWSCFETSRIDCFVKKGVPASYSLFMRAIASVTLLTGAVSPLTQWQGPRIEYIVIVASQITFRARS